VPTAVACMHLGAAHFMEKPIVGPDLARRIRRILEPGTPAVAGHQGGVVPGPGRPA